MTHDTKHVELSLLESAKLQMARRAGPGRFGALNLGILLMQLSKSFVNRFHGAVACHTKCTAFRKLGDLSCMLRFHAGDLWVSIIACHLARSQPDLCMSGHLVIALPSSRFPPCHRSCQGKMSHFSPQNLTNSLWSFAKADERDRGPRPRKDGPSPGWLVQRWLFQGQENTGRCGCYTLYT